MIVVVFCDGGEKYLSERFWDEAVSGVTRIRLKPDTTLRRGEPADGVDDHPAVDEAIRAARGRNLSRTNAAGPFTVRTAS